MFYIAGFTFLFHTYGFTGYLSGSILRKLGPCSPRYWKQRWPKSEKINKSCNFLSMIPYDLSFFSLDATLYFTVHYRGQKLYIISKIWVESFEKL